MFCCQCGGYFKEREAKRIKIEGMHSMKLYLCLNCLESIPATTESPLSVIKNLSAKEYNELPLDERLRILYANGKHYDTWSEYGKYNIGMYLLFDSIVALYYDIKTNKISDVKMWDKMTSKATIIAEVHLN